MNRELSIPGDEPLIKIIRLRYIYDTPFSINMIYIQYALLKKIPDRKDLEERRSTIMLCSGAKAPEPGSIV